jgi:hypothetical protein
MISACGLFTQGENEAAKTRVALEIFQTQTAASTATFTPTPTATATNTPEPTATPTDTPTPTPAPCSHVDLNGRYVDFRGFGPFIIGWIMEAEQHGCDFQATEVWFQKIAGPGSAGYAEELTGKITDDKLKVCYTSNNYCLTLVIFGGGQTLANGIEGWQYEKTEE